MINQAEYDKVSMTQRFLNRVILFMVRKARQKNYAEKVRKLQKETERRDDFTVRLVIYEDVKVRGIVPQHVFTYTACMQEGEFLLLNNSVAPDAIIYTDVNTIKGIRDNRTVLRTPGGQSRVEAPFTSKIAWRLGYIEVEGASRVIDNFNLFDARIMPLLRELEGDLRHYPDKAEAAA